MSTATPVNTKTVKGKRDLNFSSLDDIIVDVKHLLESDSNKVLGNWSEGQIYGHLSAGIRMMFEPEKYNFKPPFFLKLMAPFIKKSLLKNKMKPGVKLPENVKPMFEPPVDADRVQEGEELLANLDRVKSAAVGELPPSHILFGKFEHQNWIDLTLRHCELHLSFIIPE